MDEFALIATYLAPLAGKGSFGLTDDAAVVSVPRGQELVVTKDCLVEGVHFIGDEPAALIARKLLRVNLSDLAAMGATPYGYFLALMLPASRREKWLKDFAYGLQADQKEFGLALLGGDTTATSGPVSLSCTMLGLVPRDQALRRRGARVGDDIWVSGTVGDAALGLQVARGQWPALSKKFTNHRSQITGHLLSRYRLPSPRVALGQKLRSLATACIDLSDGLVQDLGHICAVSQAGAAIRWEAVPLSDAARAGMRAVKDFNEAVLAGGDDYELCFTAPPAAAAKLRRLARSLKLPLTRIGVVTKAKGVRVTDAGGREIILRRKGYRHFGSR